MGSRDCSEGIQWVTIFRIMLAGLICVGYVAGWARVGQLREESRRLDRLIQAESVRQGELAHLRAEACDTHRLEAVAQTRGMVKAPVNGDVVVIAPLPDDTEADERTVEGADGEPVQAHEAGDAPSHVGARMLGP